MSDQPKALRLADRLEKVRLFGVEEECWEAADELRRQHDQIERLAAEVANRNRRALAGDEAVAGLANVHAYYEGIEAERDAAVKALKWLDRWLGHKPMPECTAKIKAAIDAARGKT